MKNIAILFLFLPTFVFADDVLSGKWEWEGGGKTSTFSIDIKEENGFHIGQYCAVAYSGRKIDCAMAQEQSFKFINTNSKNYTFDFVNSFDGTSGKAKLSFSNGRLIWEIVNAPKGEYYAPSKATLIRVNSGPFSAADACESAPSEWQLVDGCYKKSEMARTESGAIYFWRLTDETRSGIGGGNEHLSPSAALVWESTSQHQLIKAYCPNFCFKRGNEDPLPQIEVIGDGHFAIWAPDDPGAHRHGTKGHIEILDIRGPSLERVSAEFDVGHEPPMRGMAEIDECKYLILSVLNFYTPEYSVPQGYITTEHSYLQSLSPACSSISLSRLLKSVSSNSGYERTESIASFDPEFVVPDIERTIDSEIIWIEQF